MFFGHIFSMSCISLVVTVFELSFGALLSFKDFFIFLFFFFNLLLTMLTWVNFPSYEYIFYKKLQKK